MKRFAIVLAAIPTILALLGSYGPARQASAAPPPDLRAQDEKPKDDPRLVAIGGLGASALYLSYMVIGTTADAFGKESYDAAQVKSIAESVSNILKTNIGQLADVRRGQLTKEDAGQVEEMIAVLRMIREYAKLLVDYSKDKDPKVATAFEEQRKKTWERIKKLLGIK